jgi:hypothetical protein
LQSLQRPACKHCCLIALEQDWIQEPERTPCHPRLHCGQYGLIFASESRFHQRFNPVGDRVVVAGKGPELLDALKNWTLVWTGNPMLPVQTT